MNEINSNNTDFTIELRHALDAAEKSRRFLNFLKSESIHTAPFYKIDNTPVTLADYGSQIIILFQLINQFSLDSFISEENLSELYKHKKQQVTEICKLVRYIFPEINIKDILSHESKVHPYGKRVWVIDPLDGTKGFIYNRQFSVAIALIENNKIKLGILACPKINKLNSIKYNDEGGYTFFAEQGKGAFFISAHNKLIQKININNKVKNVNVLYAESFDSSHINKQIHDQVANLLHIKDHVVKVDSQIKYALVASGDVSFYLRFPRHRDYKEYIWDHAAGQAIVEEAGGTVTDVFGNKIAYEKSNKLSKNFGIVASHGWIHDDIVKILSKFI